MTEQAGTSPLPVAPADLSTRALVRHQPRRQVGHIPQRPPRAHSPSPRFASRTLLDPTQGFGAGGRGATGAEAFSRERGYGAPINSAGRVPRILWALFATVANSLSAPGTGFDVSPRPGTFFTAST